MTTKELSDFLTQTQERSAARYHEQFRLEQMEIYKSRLQKEAEAKDNAPKTSDHESTTPTQQ